jgi:small subunit ribosomal protein S13
MARISGIDLPREKRIEIALTYIFGIGLPTAQRLLADTGVSPDVRVKDLSAEDEQKLREAIDGKDQGRRRSAA